MFTKRVDNSFTVYFTLLTRYWNTQFFFSWQWEQRTSHAEYCYADIFSARSQSADVGRAAPCPLVLRSNTAHVGYIYVTNETNTSIMSYSVPLKRWHLLWGSPSNCNHYFEINLSHIETQVKEDSWWHVDRSLCNCARYLQVGRNSKRLTDSQRDRQRNASVLYFCV